jgi:hypothetical protein
VSQVATLSDIGVTRSESSRWQEEAALPEAEFEAWLATQKEPPTSPVPDVTALPKPGDGTGDVFLKFDNTILA